MMQLRHNYNKITQPIFVALFVFVGAFLVTTLTSHSFTPVGDSSALDSEVSVEIEPSLSLAIMDKDPTSASDATTIDTMSMEVTPNASGVFISSTAYVVAGSNNETGYTLSFSDTDDNTALTNTDPTVTTTIPSITSASSSLTDIDANQWGYAFNTDTVFSPIPALSSPTTLVSTTERGSHTYPFTADSKIDMNILAGTYQDSLVFTLIANYVPQRVWEFDYTGTEQSFTAAKSGVYKLEIWGAQGGDAYLAEGGYGGYSVGEITLAESDTLYITVGGKGESGEYQTAVQEYTGGYNGGADGRNYGDTTGNNAHARSAGGGATHIATATGLLKNLSSKKSTVIIVAGGGGGAGYLYSEICSTSGPILENNLGGAGGGFKGNDGNSITRTEYVGRGGTQSAGGAGSYSNWPTGGFGYGGYGITNNLDWSGGGGGYYGGGAGHNCVASGGGGSGFIDSNLLSNKHMTCYNCATSTAIGTYTNSSTSASLKPIPDYSKKGNGYARITYIGR